ncbi:ATP phosphoribosyltransferase [Dokdonella sp.]|uniref:ATP phosphoribosyltransferase n=1 Tax=Dokdonella sp. TaxID=2291710 RepID=UPI00260CE0B2|nr:ATP phosphoribosyltransferase [Dokdonella sp.]
MTTSPDRLRIAVQKSGRLSEASLGLLRRAGLAFRASRDHLFLYGENLPIDVLLVRDDDIPGLLVEGSCELGIVGRNVLVEQRLAGGGSAAPEELLPLGFGGCRLSIAIPQSGPVAQASDLDGLRIATSYPALLADWLAREGLAAEVVVLNGSVEIAPRLGKAEAICDLVSSGVTLAANQLRELVPVFHSEAVLALSPLEQTAAKAAQIERLRSRIAGALSGDGARLIMLQAPRTALSEIRRLLPSRDQPSVLSLDGRPDDIAVQALCSSALDWQHLEELKRLGAHGLMVLNVERMLA